MTQDLRHAKPLLGDRTFQGLSSQVSAKDQSWKQTFLENVPHFSNPVLLSWCFSMQRYIMTKHEKGSTLLLCRLSPFSMFLTGTYYYQTLGYVIICLFDTNSIIYILIFIYYYPFHEAKDCSLLHSQSLKWCFAYCRYSTDICGKMNKWKFITYAIT